MVTIETISIVFTGISISLAAFYYINTLRNTRKNQELQLETRKIAVYLDYTDKTQDKEFLQNYLDVMYNQEWDTFEEWWDKYARTNPDAYSSFIRVMDATMQTMGMLLERNVIDLKMVYEDRSYALIPFWERFEPIVKGMRVKLDNNTLYGQAERLYYELIKYKEQHPEPAS